MYLQQSTLTAKMAKLGERRRNSGEREINSPFLSRPQAYVSRHIRCSQYLCLDYTQLYTLPLRGDCQFTKRAYHGFGGGPPIFTAN